MEDLLLILNKFCRKHSLELVGLQLRSDVYIIQLRRKKSDPEQKTQVGGPQGGTSVRKTRDTETPDQADKMTVTAE